MTPIDEFLRKIKPGEPIFCLRAQDVTAPVVVEGWAAAVEHRVSGRDPSEHALTLAKIKEARALAHEMRAWQARNGSKVPD